MGELLQAKRKSFTVLAKGPISEGAVTEGDWRS